jgi:hypothetical protein
MPNDLELLRRYAREGSPEALAERVRRRVDLVYSTVRRGMGGDKQAAEERVQNEFGDLARKASRPCQHPALRGWFFTSTRDAPRRHLAPVLAIALWAGAHCVASARAAEDVEAISSRTVNGYVRARLTDGTYAPESYVFKKGVYWGGFFADVSMDQASLPFVEKAIAGALASQRYVRATDPKDATLLIEISWGSASPPAALMNPRLDYAREQPNADQAFSQELRDLGAHTAGANPLGSPSPPSPDAFLDGSLPGRASERFAERIDEYQQVLAQLTVSQNASMMGLAAGRDPELGEARYFVALRAFENPLKARHRKSKLLWEARFSISERDMAFDRELAAMARAASAYFGRDSRGLRHEAMHEGHVEIGEVKSLGFLPDLSAVALAADGTRVAYLSEAAVPATLWIISLDEPGRVVSADISALAAFRIHPEWTDPSHVAVVGAPQGPVYFDTLGHVSEPTRAAQLGTPGEPIVQPEKAFGPADVQERARDKFPHRHMAVLGSDLRGDRWLLRVGGGAGPDRFFVWDLPKDVLYEVARADPSP